MKKYTLAQVGCGRRGADHIEGFVKNADRFAYVGLCDLDEAKMKAAAEKFGVEAPLYTDAGTMLAETQPDLFCFSTMPDLRLPMVELAAAHGVKALAFEKPMALSLAEGKQIVEICREHGIKATVCHQHKYLPAMRKLKEIIDAGEIGEVGETHATSRMALTDLGTHFIDYMMWANDFARPQWVVGHVHGRAGLDGVHPSPDFYLARMHFANGVRGLVEIGRSAPIYEAGQEVWQVNRLTVRGTLGYAWAETSGIWGALTKSSNGAVLRGTSPGYTPENPGGGWAAQYPEAQRLYARDIAHWLDGTLADHPCNVEHAYAGFELMNAACASALEHRRVDLPLSDLSTGANVIEQMKKVLPECPERD